MEGDALHFWQPTGEEPRESVEKEEGEDEDGDEGSGGRTTGAEAGDKVEGQSAGEIRGGRRGGETAGERSGLGGGKRGTGKSGVMYVSRVPPGMDVSAMRGMLSRVGKVGRIWLRGESVERSEERV